MNIALPLPRLLVIDDLFGRTVPGKANRERANLCGQYLLQDVTGDETCGTEIRVKHPIAQAVFHRGQAPAAARVGDQVENDLDGTLTVIRGGWSEWHPARPRWALVLLDLCFYTGRVTGESHRRAAGMPEGRPTDDDPSSYFGLRLLQAIQERFPDLPVVILSSKPRDDVSRVFARYGALAFLPRADERSPELLREYVWRHGLVPDETGEIVGHSKALLLALRAARRALADRRNVLIRGARGTGKELLARYIHRQSDSEANRPLVIVDSGALSPQLYASELFGHVRGAFTGAEGDRIGRIAQADCGDLFLDEIGNMPMDVQIGLLRVLEQREVTPLGARAGRGVDVRFLAATNEDLEGKAATGGFRQDLLDRLREGGTVFLRPLCERREDIDPLVERLVREAENAKPGAMKRQIEPEALERLRNHDWPGNVRELRNCVYSAVFDYPDVEHLVPVHLRLDDRDEPPRTLSLQDPVPIAGKGRLSATLDDLMRLLGEVRLDGVKPTDLVGKLPHLQQAYARLAADLLRAALLATRKVTTDNPDGEILIHPAMKLITGDKGLTASQAADLIKRLLALSPEVEKEMSADPILNEAYETALRLRPRQPKK